MIDDVSAEQIPAITQFVAASLTITTVCRWYHRRVIHVIKTVAPEAGPFHAIGWDPVYSGEPITRRNWPGVPAGRRRVFCERDEVARHVADSSFAAAKRLDGAWR